MGQIQWNWIPPTYSSLTAPLTGRIELLALLLNPVEQVEDGHAQCVRNDFDGVQGRVGFAILDPAKVGLVEATFLAKLDLALACLKAQRPNA
jgi:hypothetical protein